MTHADVALTLNKWERHYGAFIHSRLCLIHQHEISFDTFIYLHPCSSLLLLLLLLLLLYY